MRRSFGSRGSPSGWVVALTTFAAACGGGGGGDRVDTTPPSTPPGFSAVAVSATAIDVTWLAATDDVGVTGYRVRRDGAPLATQPGLLLHDAGLAPATAHCYTVTALDAAGNASPPTAPACATTQALAPPGAPVGLEALGGDGQVTLRWEPVAGATSYDAYVGPAPGVSKTTGTRVAGVTSPWVHAGLTNLDWHFYVVVAVGPGGSGPESAQVAAQPVRGRRWDFIQPLGTAERLAAVRLAGDRGWIAGGAGTILATADGGATWAAQAAATTAGLEDLDFVDASSGWAVGGAGPVGGAWDTILHTTDGGLTWRAQAAGDAPPLSGVDFVDALHGWAVGGAGVILRTADGGRTWSARPSGTSALLWKVRFLDAGTGWVAGGNGTEGVVLRTTDGGETWRSATVLNAQLVDLWFVSATRGFAVDAATPGRLLATTDGGATWGPVPTGSSASLRAVTFADASTGWIAGTSGEVRATVDGGATWTPAPTGVAAGLLGLAARSAQNLAAVGPGYVLVSSDGGATWAWRGRRTLPAFEPATLAFTGAATGWAAAGDTAYRTADGGFGWTAQPVFAGGRLGWLEFASPTAGFAVEAGDGTCAAACNAVHRTLDGGTTWEARGAIAGAGMQVSHVDFADEAHGWAVGVDGLIRATSDGGATWTTQPSGAGATLLWTVAAVDGSTAWAASTDGLILKTVDGGAHWSGQASGTTGWLRAVSAVDAGHAWVVGSQGGFPFVLATVDGGATWTAQPHPGGLAPLNDVRFVDRLTGWVVGDGGLVMGTTDGGATWARQESGTALDLLRLQAASATTAWIAVQGGDLLVTQTGGW